jgi:hypothetical protein
MARNRERSTGIAIVAYQPPYMGTSPTSPSPNDLLASVVG